MSDPKPGLSHDTEAHRYLITVDGTEAGYAGYELLADGRGETVRDFNHTVIHPEFRGRGLSAPLIRYALEDTIAEKLTFRPTCSAVEYFITKHPEYATGVTGTA